MSNTLKTCPSSPNCVCSAYPDDGKHYIAPLKIPNRLEPQNSMAHFKKAIEAAGGEITDSSDEHLTATFTSQVFKFVDDIDAQLDLDNQVIHIRSASRVGYYDFGANKARVEKLRALFI